MSENSREALKKSYGHIFSRYNYSDENIPLAALYLDALEMSIFLMTSLDAGIVAMKEDFLALDTVIEPDSTLICQAAINLLQNEQSSYEEVVSTLGLLCYKAAINEKEPALSFCQLFVKSWCEYLSLN